MPRSIDAQFKVQTKAAHVGYLVGLARMAFDSGEVLVTSAPFTIPWDWNGAGDADFLGVGAMGRVSAVEESSVVQPYSIALELTGIDPAYLSLALNEHCQGRDLRIWSAILDEDYQLAAAPTLRFRGRMDTMKVYIGKTRRIVLNAHSRLSDWDKARVRRFTHADQTSRWSGDLWAEFNATTADKELRWGG